MWKLLVVALATIPPQLLAQDVKCLFTLKGHTQPVRAVTFSSDGKLLASGAGDNDAPGGEVKLWNVSTGKEIELNSDQRTGTHAVSFSPDGKWLATGEYRQIRVWNLATSKVEKVLQAKDGNAAYLAFTPDGKQLYGSLRGTFGMFPMPGVVKLWIHATGEEVKTFKEARAVCLAYSPRISTLALSSTNEQAIEIWDTSLLKQRTQLTGYKLGITALALSTNGNCLAAGGGERYYNSNDQTSSWEGEVCLWDIQSGKKLRQLQGVNGLVTSTAFSPDDRLLATASFSLMGKHELKLWETSNGKLLAEIKGHEHWVRAVSFSADGKMLASASEDQTVKLWDISNK